MDRFPLRKIKLYDNDEERQNQLAKACEILVKETDSEIEFLATVDPEEAYTDVDFCLAHIRVGQLKMREFDEKIAFKHGCVGQELVDLAESLMECVLLQVCWKILIIWKSTRLMPGCLIIQIQRLL